MNRRVTTTQIFWMQKQQAYNYASNATGQWTINSTKANT